MSDWQPKLKNYPHFDAAISNEEIDKLVRDPKRVAANTFYPFMRYAQTWQPFRSREDPDNGQIIKPDKKTRPIRFASRRDAYILSYYRYLLAASYEPILEEEGIADCVIAYRKLKQANGVGKSNVEFARDAFDTIRGMGDCGVVALDISSFFESLDHGVLRKQWCRILGVETLPPDHEAVFRAMTKYAVVDRDAVYQRLGYLKEDYVKGKRRLVYTVPYTEMPRKLCNNKDFREKVCGAGGGYKSLVDVNRKPYGIPQGAPISDLLANIYMLDFDRAAREYCSLHNGRYSRYSDDILIIIPGGGPEALAARDFVRDELRKHGEKLTIKDKKTCAVAYRRTADGSQECVHVSGQQGGNGLEYLGFRYDGRHVFLRDATVANLYRKISAGLKAECANLVARYRGHDAAFLVNKFNFPEFFQRYGRVPEFDPKGDYDTWTFWTYARKATKAFGARGSPIPRQLKRVKQVVRGRVPKELARRLAKV